MFFFSYKRKNRNAGFRNSVASFQSTASSIVWGKGKKEATEKKHSSRGVVGRPYDSGEEFVYDEQ